MIQPHRQATAAASGLSAVLLGAFGAHALQGILTPYQSHIWETAVFYQFVHTLVLLFLSREPNQAKAAFIAFTLGILFFSGSLYLYAVTRIGWLVFVTPFGGVAFLIGWTLLLLSSFKIRK